MPTIYLILCFLTSGFQQKWYFPQGTDYGIGRVCIGDADRDGNYEFIFTTYGLSYTIYFYELHLPDIWEIDSSYNLNAPLLWDFGDSDRDGFYDLIMQCGSVNPFWTGLSILESPDSFSYPTQEVWRDTAGIGGGAVAPISLYDVDRDGIPEILYNQSDELGFGYAYEALGDNQYRISYLYPVDVQCEHAIGDFDEDGKIEVATGDLSAGPPGADVWVLESPANDSIEQVFHTIVPTKNIIDCFALPDADGDGKCEFVVKGFTPLDAQTHCFIFEATADNTYQIIQSYNLFNNCGWDYYGGYSDVGDVDGDGRPEIALEAASYVYLINSAGNDSFYLWDTLPGHPDGNCVRVFDIDGNGLSEIIISGGNQTRIYEKTPDVTWFSPEPGDTFSPLDTVLVHWSLDETISLDSLRLYWSHPQFGCHLFFEGLPSDTVCDWVAPDTQSNIVFRFWLVLQGFGRYDSVSSPPFYVRRETGVDEKLSLIPDISGLWVYPNPFSKQLNIGYQSPNGSRMRLRIYDIAGRIVRRYGQMSPVVITWDGTDDDGQELPSGIYFVQLRMRDKVITRKVLRLR